jgi:imidazolonepropionase
MNILIKNIGELAGITPQGMLRKQGSEMDEVASIKNAYLLAQNGRISGFGPMTECPGAGRGRPACDIPRA